MKDIKEMTYQELLNYLTGSALMNIGSGESLRSTVSFIMNCTNQWTHALRDKQEKEKYGENYKK